MVSKKPPIKKIPNTDKNNFKAESDIKDNYIQIKEFGMIG